MDHIAQMCMLFESKGESRPLAMAKANHVDAYKQLPMKREAELAAVVTLKNPNDGLRYGFIPLTQLICPPLQSFLPRDSFVSSSRVKDPLRRILWRFW